MEVRQGTDRRLNYGNPELPGALLCLNYFTSRCNICANYCYYLIKTY